jgi:hypothetical protein
VGQVKIVLLFYHTYSILLFNPFLSTKEPPLGTVIRRGISVIGQNQLMATPSTSQNYEGVTSEPYRVVNGVVPHAPEMLHSEDPNEEEIGIYSFFPLISSFI